MGGYFAVDLFSNLFDRRKKRNWVIRFYPLRPLFMMSLQVTGRESIVVRALYIVLACLQNMLCGGIFFGWSSISGTLLLAPESEGGAGLSVEYVQAIYVVATFTNSLGPLFLGVILDSYGPRACSIVSLVIVALGGFLFSLSNTRTFDMFMPGMCMISFGGSGVQNAIIHLSNLFPEYKGTMTAIITGSFQLSFVVFYMFDLAWKADSWSFASLFQSYAILTTCCIALSFPFWPDSAVNYDEQMSVLYGKGGGLELTVPEESANRDRNAIMRLPSKMLSATETGGGSGHYDAISRTFDRHKIEKFFAESTPTPQPAPKAMEIFAHEMAHLTHTERWCMESGCIASGDDLNPMVQSLGQQLTSLAFIRINILFVCCSFWANFYIGTVVTQLADLSIVPENEISKYGSSLTLFMTAGVLFIPFVGWLLDGYGYPTTMFATILFSIIWAVLLCLRSASYLMASFVAYALFRTFLYTFIFSYMSDRLGFQFFGILVGVLFVISGFVGLLQYPLSEWAYGDCYSTHGEPDCSHGEWNFLNHLMLANFVILLFFPYQDHVERRELLRRASSSMYSFSRFPEFVE